MKRVAGSQVSLVFLYVKVRVLIVFCKQHHVVLKNNNVFVQDIKAAQIPKWRNWLTLLLWSHTAGTSCCQETYERFRPCAAFLRSSKKEFSSVLSCSITAVTCLCLCALTRSFLLPQVCPRWILSPHRIRSWRAATSRSPVRWQEVPLPAWAGKPKPCTPASSPRYSSACRTRRGISFHSWAASILLFRLLSLHPEGGSDQIRSDQSSELEKYTFPNLWTTRFGFLIAIANIND